ncbi:MAG: 16S rRNA (cytidine(1402)-2'-O)-methyltransferase [Syntrophales bacterium]|jgi:16S rRNA (cytidine1402-2'-O)-methyltransferase|nr:16S rRNA (cytidine(1402)-2'-O)-methyltransferase [Syntrophales bacterium]
MKQNINKQSKQFADKKAVAEKPVIYAEMFAPARNTDRDHSGTLYLVATPIGNLEDITFRAVRVLREVSLIAAEDTRHTRILLERYNISTPLTSLYDQIEREKSGLIIARLLGGEDVAYVSDAGTPGISDPGYILVREAVLRGIKVSPIPGASALVASLCVSGLPMESFVFMGFLPSKASRRRQLLTKLREEEKTVIFYESPNRLRESLNDIREIWGDRNMVVSRELTKIHEEFVRGSATEALAAFQGRAVKGEITLVVAGFLREKSEVSDEEIKMRGEELIESGEKSLSRRDAASRIAQETGESRRRIYKLLSV